MLLAEVVAASAAVAATRARTAKAAAIAELLRRAEPGEVPAVTAWLAGDPLQNRLGVGWRTLTRLAREPAAEPSLTVDAVDAVLTGLAATSGAGSTARRETLLAALQVWATNVIAFALLYWELDRGGPVARVSLPREKIPLADFRFTQDETKDTVAEVAAGSSQKADWIPLFVDYLYLSTTNSSAFSPTDTMPLSTRAKMLMGVQATAALFTSLLVIARAVGSLGGGG